MDYQENQAAGMSLGEMAGARTQQAINARRAAMNGDDDGCLAQGPLDNITGRIERATLAAIEIGNKLNAHADRVHGPGANKTINGSASIERSDTVRDRAPGALQRVFEAIANLDQAQNYLAEAADRNSSLA